MKKYSGSIMVFIGILLLSVQAYADDGRSPLTLSIDSVTALAIENNLDIKLESLDISLGKDNITKEYALFDPSFSFTIDAEKKITPSASAFASPNVGITQKQTLDIGISQRLKTGAQYTFTFSNERLKSNSSFTGLNPQYIPRLKLEFSQPLLKGFGLSLNTSEIRIAKNNKDISFYKFIKRVNDVVADAQKAYWDLVFRIQDLEVKKRTLKLAKDLEKRMMAFVEAGTMAPIKVIQARAEVASREEGVIIAENEVKNSEDRLKFILNIIDTPEYKGKEIAPLSEEVTIENTSSLEKALDSAYKNRPELQEAMLALNNKDIELYQKKNQLHPSVDFIGGVGLNGLSGGGNPVSSFNSSKTSSSSFSGSYGKGLERLLKGDFYEWEAGISIKVPLFNREAKSRYRTAIMNAKKQAIVISNIKKKILLEVKNTLRKIEANKSRIYKTKTSRKLAEEKVRIEQQRFDVGLTTSFNVLEYQRDLAVERSREILARVDYKKSLIDHKRAIGTLLKENRIEITGAGKLKNRLERKNKSKDKN